MDFGELDERDAARYVAKMHRDSLTIALKDGWLLGAADCFKAILGMTGTNKDYKGPLPDEFVAWCKKAMDNMLEMQSK